MDQVKRAACQVLHPRFGRRAEDRLLLAETEADRARRDFKTKTDQVDRRASSEGGTTRNTS